MHLSYKSVLWQAAAAAALAMAPGASAGEGAKPDLVAGQATNPTSRPHPDNQDTVAGEGAPKEYTDLNQDVRGSDLAPKKYVPQGYDSLGSNPQPASETAFEPFPGGRPNPAPAATPASPAPAPALPRTLPAPTAAPSPARATRAPAYRPQPVPQSPAPAPAPMRRTPQQRLLDSIRPSQPTYRQPSSTPLSSAPTRRPQPAVTYSRPAPSQAAPTWNGPRYTNAYGTTRPTSTPTLYGQGTGRSGPDGQRLNVVSPGYGPSNGGSASPSYASSAPPSGGEGTGRLKFGYDDNMPKSPAAPRVSPTSAFQPSPAPQPKGVLMRLGISPDSLQSGEAPDSLLARIRGDS